MRAHQFIIGLVIIGLLSCSTSRDLWLEKGIDSTSVTDSLKTVEGHITRHIVLDSIRWTDSLGIKTKEITKWRIYKDTIYLTRDNTIRVGSTSIKTSILPGESPERRDPPHIMLPIWGAVVVIILFLLIFFFIRR